jgi:signal peptidase I
LVTVIVITSFRSAVADWNYVPTGSMKPTILVGDRIVVNKLAYDLKIPFTTWHLLEWAHPERGEVVVFYAPHNGVRYVKRVIAVPGDEVEMRDNQLFVNGEPASYEPLPDEVRDQIPGAEQGNHIFAREQVGGDEHPIMVTPDRESIRSFEPLIVPAGQYFVMGDNRDNSLDSRWFGFLARDLIVGRATAVAISLDPDQHYQPRWHRFWRSLR